MIWPMPARSTSRWLVYLLRCSDGSLYTGITNDLPKRLKAHAASKVFEYFKPAGGRQDFCISTEIS
jgi:predicted GIY-YIG superfamily endonuclease